MLQENSIHSNYLLKKDGEMIKVLSNIQGITQALGITVNVKGKIRTLGEYKGSLILGASAPLALYKLRRNKDLDIQVDNQALWESLVETYPSYVRQSMLGSPTIKIGNVELFLRSPGTSVGDVPTEVVEGVRIWTLQGLLVWKKQMNRPKDQDDIVVINQFLKLMK